VSRRISVNLLMQKLLIERWWNWHLDVWMEPEGLPHRLLHPVHEPQRLVVETVVRWPEGQSVYDITHWFLILRKIWLYRLIHGFGRAKFAYSGSILGSSQFTLLPQLPVKMMLNLKVVKNDLKKSSRFINLNPWHTL